MFGSTSNRKSNIFDIFIQWYLDFINTSIQYEIQSKFQKYYPESAFITFVYIEGNKKVFVHLHFAHAVEQVLHNPTFERFWIIFILLNDIFIHNMQNIVFHPNFFSFLVR